MRLEIMKLYFAKHLPVEGEIEQGDMFLYKGSVIECSSRENDIVYGPRTGNFATTIAEPEKIETYNTSGGFAGWKQNCKKVKLMLCSRDIKVGDDIWFTGLGGNLKQAKFHHLCKSLEGEDVVDITEHGECTGFLLGSDGFKVIGEISKEATWVKEGDEFEEDDIMTFIMGDDYYMGVAIRGKDGNWY